MKSKTFIRLIGLFICLGFIIYSISIFYKLSSLSTETIGLASYPSVIDSIIPSEYRAEMKFIKAVRYEKIGIVSEFKDRDGGEIYIVQLNGKLGSVRKEAKTVNTAKEYGYFLEPFSLIGFKTYFSLDKVQLPEALNNFDLRSDASQIEVLNEDDNTKNYLLRHAVFMQLLLNGKDLFHLKRKGRDRNRTVQLILKESFDSTYIVLKIIREEKDFHLIW